MAHIQEAQKILQEQHVDALFVSSPLHIGYITDFFGISPTERESFVFVTKSACYIFTSPLYFEDIKETCKQSIAIELSVNLSWTKAIENITQKENIQTIGFEATNLTVAEHNRLTTVAAKLIPISLQKLREIKDSGEITAMQKACAIGDETFTFVLDYIKPGITEEEIAFEMELFMRKKHSVPSFPTIVAFGKHAAVPHHRSGKKELVQNQFILLDFGVQIQNFCSDMTRTIYIGNISNKEKKVYETVLSAQQKAIEYLSRNAHEQAIEAAVVDTIARDYIVSAGFPQFPHSLGHGIGLEVHESPSLSPYSKDILKQGMIFSIEPGIYLPEETGVRIEDLATLTSSTCQLLTHAPKELLII